MKKAIFGARLDYGGLGMQTLAMAKFLKPDKILAIDSTGFNQGSTQDYERYDGFENYRINGFPTNADCVNFLKGVTHVVACETVYNNAFYSFAKMRDVKVYTQPNWEFSDHAVNPSLAKPYQFLMPSYWHLEDMQALFPNTIYLPPPTFPNDFKDARDINFKRTGRRKFLHVVGKYASEDRNGTLTILEALKHTKSDFQLVIRAQHEIPELQTDDNRVTYAIGNIQNQGDMYRDFDAMLMPRRYGGLCLPMNEALMSGLPVIMTDISPNNKVLPPEWLVGSEITGTLKTRQLLDLYSADPLELAYKIDWLCETELTEHKINALEIGYNKYSPQALQKRYEAIW